MRLRLFFLRSCAVWRSSQWQDFFAKVFRNRKIFNFVVDPVLYWLNLWISSEVLWRFFVCSFEQWQHWCCSDWKKFVLIFSQIKNCCNNFSLQCLLVGCCKVFEHFFNIFEAFWLLWVYEKHKNGLVGLLINFWNEWVAYDFPQYFRLLLFFSGHWLTFVFRIDSFHPYVFNEFYDVLLVWLTMVFNFKIVSSELEVTVICFC